MTRREMCRHRYRTGLQGFAIFQDFDAAYTSNGNDQAELWIIARHDSPLHDIGRPRTRGNASTAQFLQFCNTAGVIEVNVRVHAKLDVFDAK